MGQQKATLHYAKKKSNIQKQQAIKAQIKPHPAGDGDMNEFLYFCLLIWELAIRILLCLYLTEGNSIASSYLLSALNKWAYGATITQVSKYECYLHSCNKQRYCHLQRKQNLKKTTSQKIIPSWYWKNNCPHKQHCYPTWINLSAQMNLSHPPQNPNNVKIQNNSVTLSSAVSNCFPE